jgi:hypothetical protein
MDGRNRMYWIEETHTKFCLENLKGRRNHMKDLGKDRVNIIMFFKTRFTCFEVLHHCDCPHCGLLCCDNI